MKKNTSLLALLVVFIFVFAGCRFLTRDKTPENYAEMIAESVNETEPVSEPEASDTGDAQVEIQPQAEVQPDAAVETADSDSELPATLPDKVLIEGVPFTGQAPFANWDDDRHQDGCEEASMIMAMHWVQGDPTLTAAEADKAIKDISAFELEHYGYYNDTSAQDTAKLIKEYFKHEAVEARTGVSADDIKRELAAGNLVMLPINGQLLGNPYFTAPGPERHMLVVIGYDTPRDVFITQEPGTRRGEQYTYGTSVLINAVANYPSGKHAPMTGEPGKAMIIVRKS